MASQPGTNGWILRFGPVNRTNLAAAFETSGADLIVAVQRQVNQSPNTRNWRIIEHRLMAVNRVVQGMSTILDSGRSPRTRYIMANRAAATALPFCYSSHGVGVTLPAAPLRARRHARVRLLRYAFATTHARTRHRLPAAPLPRSTLPLRAQHAAHYHCRARCHRLAAPPHALLLPYRWICLRAAALPPATAYRCCHCCCPAATLRTRTTTCPLALRLATLHCYGSGGAGGRHAHARTHALRTRTHAHTTH